MSVFVRRRVRELKDDGALRHAAFDIKLWGYPRDLEPTEMETSAVFRFGPDVIFWIQVMEADPEMGVLHVVIAPGSRGRHGVAARYWLSCLDVLSDLLGLRRLVSSDCVEGGPVASYLERIGWEPRPIPELEDGESGWWVKEYPSFNFFEDDDDVKAGPT